MNQSILGFLSSMVGVLAGALVTYLVAKWQLRLSSRELQDRSDAMIRASNEIQQSLISTSTDLKAELTSTTGDLKLVSEAIQSEIRAVHEEATGLQDLSREIGKQIVNIQEVTRHLLRSFPEIFAKAATMLDDCNHRFWMLNFTPCFGRIHTYNPRYIEEFSRLVLHNSDINLSQDQLSFERAVTRFVGSIQTTAQIIAEFRLATTDPKDFEDGFLKPVLSKVQPEDLTEDVGAVLTKLLADHTMCLDHIRDHLTARGKMECVTLLERVPLQMFIADKYGEKDVAIVFFVGTDNIAVESEVKGFYTEHEPLVELLKEIFESIVQQQERLGSASRDFNRPRKADSGIGA